MCKPLPPHIIWRARLILGCRRVQGPHQHPETYCLICPYFPTCTGISVFAVHVSILRSLHVHQNENQKNWSWLYNFLSIEKQMILYTSIISEWAICFVEGISSNLVLQIIQTQLFWHSYDILETFDVMMIIFFNKLKYLVKLQAFLEVSSFKSHGSYILIYSVGIILVNFLSSRQPGTPLW